MEDPAFTRRWEALGRFIGSHMIFFAPACLVVGVIFAPWIGFFRPIVPTLFIFLSFQGSLRIRLKDLNAIVRRPIPALTILLVAFVGMPLAAWAASALFFPGNHDVMTGMVLEFSEPLAVMSFMWVSMYSGNLVMALVVIMVSSVLAPLTMPLTLSLLVGENVAVDSLGIMGQVLYMVAIPSIIGLFVNERSGGWGARVLAPKLVTPSRLVMLVVLTVNATAMASYLSQINWSTLGIAVLVLAFVIFGYALGLFIARLMRCSYEDRITFCFSCGMRNISLGAVIAADYFSGPVVFTVLIAIMYQQITAACYGKALEKAQRNHEASSKKLTP